MNKHRMHDNHMHELKSLTLAPYIQLAITLVDIPRKHLSNAFRHQMATLAILIDYGYTDSVLLKASVIHDLLEDVKHFDRSLILRLDDGPAVLDLVLEVSKKDDENKRQFLERILNNGSNRAKVLKSADRISNLIDIGFTTNESFIERYLSETVDCVVPMALQVNLYMVEEMVDLVVSRRGVLEAIRDSVRR